MGTKILFAACFVPVAFLMFGMLYFEGTRKGNILLGVTLWPGAEQSELVQGIRRRYRNQMWALLWGSLALYAASLLPRRTSLSFAIQMIWLILEMVVFFLPHVWGNGRLKEAKREWMEGRVTENGERAFERQAMGSVEQAFQGQAMGSVEQAFQGQAMGSVEQAFQGQAMGSGEQEFASRGQQDPAKSGARRYVDLGVAAQAQAQPKPFWKAGFVGALLGFAPAVGELFLWEGWWTEASLLSLAVGGMAILWVMWHFWRMRTDVVSYRSEANQQVARVRQYQWGRVWCVAVWENSAFTFALWHGLRHPERLFWIALAGTLAVTASLLALALIAGSNIRKAYDAYAEEGGWNDEGEDAHWLGGIFYCNKNDNRFLVNKRVGIGTTVNLGKRSGRVFMWVTGVFTVGLLLWVTGLLLVDEFVPISMEVEQGQVVSRQLTEEYRIPMEDIVEAELVWELPSLSKRVGTATETIYKGSFLDKEYQRCKVCVRVEAPPFVKILTKDGTIYYLNDEEQAETEAAYEQLTR